MKYCGPIGPGAGVVGVLRLTSTILGLRAFPQHVGHGTKPTTRAIPNTSTQFNNAGQLPLWGLEVIIAFFFRP
jgi:hypothetical protein